MESNRIIYACLYVCDDNSLTSAWWASSIFAVGGRAGAWAHNTTVTGGGPGWLSRGRARLVSGGRRLELYRPSRDDIVPSSRGPGRRQSGLGSSARVSGHSLDLRQAVIYSLTEIETETEISTFALTGTETKTEIISKTETK